LSILNPQSGMLNPQLFYLFTVYAILGE